jgi:hypothetical protein
MITAEDIIGVFDIEATTVSQDTRNFLNSAAKRKCDVSCTEEMPRSFVVTFDKEYLDEKVYISRINPKTIEKRIRK